MNLIVTPNQLYNRCLESLRRDVYSNSLIRVVYSADVFCELIELHDVGRERGIVQGIILSTI